MTMSHTVVLLDNPVLEYRANSSVPVNIKAVASRIANYFDNVDTSTTRTTQTYFVPFAAVHADLAKEKGIEGVGNLYGGVVRHHAHADKAILHITPTQRSDAEIPSWYSQEFSYSVQDAVLPGYTAFTAEDVMTGYDLMQHDGFAVRLKDPANTGGLGQHLVNGYSDLHEALVPYRHKLHKTGIVLEKLRRIETNESKKPFKAPRYTFASHRMAINDTKLILKRIADTHDDVRLGETLIEEKGWRYYTNQAGVATSLRPDMYAVTHRGHLKHHWFIEVDCNTEAPVRIIAKCNMYLDYMACTIDSGDGWCCGQFPAVLWVVPTIKRRDALKRHIAENFPDFPVGQPFIVVTPQELPALIAEGKLGELREVSYE